MTELGCGNTALTICASWLTVTLISLNNAAIPGSDVGGGSSGLPMLAQLGVSRSYVLVRCSSHIGPVRAFPIFAFRHLFLRLFDDAVLRNEEVVLVDVDLHARSAAVKVLQRLRAVLSSDVYSRGHT